MLAASALHSARTETAVVKFRLDINFGDPMIPAPQSIELPALRPNATPIRCSGTRSKRSLLKSWLPRSISARPTPASVTGPTSTPLPAATR
jgi:hypothetical protein